MAQWRTAAGNQTTPALWSAASTWQYWNGSAWTAAPYVAQDYPSINDDVLFHGGFRVRLDIDAEVNTITNISNGFNGTHTILTNVSGLVYTTNQTLICRGSTSVAGTANTNISAYDQALIYPNAAGVSITLGSGAYPAYIKGLAVSTGSRGTLSLLDATTATNYTSTFNIIGNSNTLIGGGAGGGWAFWIGNGSTLTLNLDGVISAGVSTAISLNTTGILVLNLNGTIQPVGTVPAIFITSGAAVTINTKSGGTTNINGGTGSASLINTGGQTLSSFTLNLTAGSTITSGVSATPGNGAALLFNAPTTATSITLSGVSIAASTSANAISLGTLTYTNFSLTNNCIVTNTTERNALVTPRLNADSTTKFNIKTAAGVNNLFEVSAAAYTLPSIENVLSGVIYGVTGSTLTGTLTQADAATVLSGTNYGVISSSNSANRTGTLNIGASVWDYLTSSATTSNSLGKLIVDNLNAKVGDVKTATDRIPLNPASIESTGDQIAAYNT